MIVNKSRHDYCLVRDLHPAFTFWRRLLGLMFRASLPVGSGLLIAPCQSVHTMHMRFPIDVVFLNKSWGVVGLERYLAPWRVSPTYRDSWFVLECPAGTIDHSGTELGDRLECTWKQ